MKYIVVKCGQRGAIAHVVEAVSEFEVVAQKRDDNDGACVDHRIVRLLCARVWCRYARARACVQYVLKLCSYTLHYGCVHSPLMAHRLTSAFSSDHVLYCTVLEPWQAEARVRVWVRVRVRERIVRSRWRAEAERENTANERRERRTVYVETEFVKADARRLVPDVLMHELHAHALNQLINGS